MKAIICSAWGAPDSLQLLDMPSPTPGPRQVVVRTRVAAVNYPDALMVAGRYQFRPEFPFSPGGELSGEVIATGAEVKRLKVGDKVVAIAPFGAYAQEIAVDEANTIPLPPGIDDAGLELAGSFVLTYGTSLHAIKDRAAAREGETMLVLGAGGGVGLAAVEIGKLLGLRVIAAASSEAKREAAREHGADETLDYTQGDLREQVKALTGGRGVDIVYDPVGGEFTEPALRCVGWGGRLLVVGFAGGAIPKVPINLLLLKGSALVGVFWGEFVKREPELNVANMKQLFAWLAGGQIRPHISRRYRLDEAPAALQAMLDREALGKLVVLPQQVG